MLFFHPISIFVWKGEQLVPHQDYIMRIMSLCIFLGGNCMLKIFLTGDNHIGLKYVNHPHREQLLAFRISAFESMVRCANQENCDLFVIAGDLFERTKGIAKRDIRQLMNILSQFHGTVVILPGNHDYYGPDVPVWQDVQATLADVDNILLLTEFAPHSLNVGEKTVVLYPALCQSLHSAPGENNLGWIKETEIPRNDAYHIGIAHGAVDGETIDREGAYFRMNRKELEAIPVDVWLIGHTHVPFPRDLTASYCPKEKIFNAGTHVQTDVNCDTEGQCFLIEIGVDKQVRARKYVSGNVHFLRREIYLSAGEMEETLRRELSGVDTNTVVDLVLSGAVTAEEYDARHDISEEILSRFLEGTYTDTDLTKQITRELIESEYPETSFSAKLLTQLLEEPKEAQLLYELLNTLKEGKK